MFHPGRAYERFCDRVWMGFCIWMMLRAPKLYAWLSKDVSLLSKEQEARVVDFQQEKEQRQAASSPSSSRDFREVGLQAQRPDVSGIIIAITLAIILIGTVVVLRPNPW